MKAKYLLVGALMLGIAVPALAQDDATTAAIKSMAKVIKSDAPADKKEDQLKDLFKPYKKDPKVMVGVGQAYLEAKDYDNAEKYAQMAIKRDKNNGDAYVLLGDIAAGKDDGGQASAWYTQAMRLDPKNPIGYRRYAMVNSKVNPEDAVSTLEELRKQRPDYPVDIISAEIYDKAGNLDKALEYYNKVDKTQMEEYQLVSYALAYFLKGEFQKSLDVVTFALGKFPKNPGLNRLSFYNLTNLQRYDEALVSADALFNKSEDAKITESDYLYSGYANLGKKNYDEAVKQFQKSIEMNKDNEADRIDAQKKIAEAYKEKGDYTNAIAAYETYLKGQKAQTANDLNDLARIYMYAADDSTKTAAEKEQLYMKADGIYATMAEKIPSVADFATLQRAHIGFALDPDTKKGTAKPFYEKLVEIIKAKTTKGAQDNDRLVEAYSYLGYYFLQKNEKANSDVYWKKILEIDPNNAKAKQVLGIK